MTEKEYNEIPAIRRSDLWKMEESPEKYKYNLEHPAEQTPAMAFGTAAHKNVLEPETFDEEYAVAPMTDRRTKEGKAIWEQFTQENQGKKIISMDDFDTLMGMGKALKNCADAEAFLFKNAENAENEAPFVWTDPDTGEQCKIRCDRILYQPWNKRYVVVDYKTANSAQTDRFNAEIFRLGYHVQAAMYTEGVQTAKQLKERPDFVFVVQEKKEPYSVNVIQVSEDVMGVGDAIYHELLQRVHECMELDYWPGYTENGINETTLPGWWSLDEEEL